jgi:hypothetical protein
MWQHQGRALAVPGADRAEYVGRSGLLIVWRRRPRAALGPAPGDLVLLSDPSLVGEPDFYVGWIDALGARDLLQNGREF